MFKHIVMWRFKPEVKQEDQVEMKRQLEALLDEVPSLQAIEVGLNVAEGDAAFDVVLTTVFEDEFRRMPRIRCIWKWLILFVDWYAIELSLIIFK